MRGKARPAGIALFRFTLSSDEFARTLLTAGTDNTLPFLVIGVALLGLWRVRKRRG